MRFDDLVQRLLENFYDVKEIDFDFTGENTEKVCQYIFGELWGDWMKNEIIVELPDEEKSHFSDMNLADAAPEYKRFLSNLDSNKLYDKVLDMIADFENANGDKDIRELYKIALEKDGESLEHHDEERSSSERFFYTVIMRMLGYHIYWEDDHNDPELNYPDKNYSISYFNFKSFKDKKSSELENLRNTETEEEYQEEDNEGDEWKM